MKRTGITLDHAIDKAYLAYETTLVKRGINSKKELKRRLLDYYAPQDLEKHVLRISLDKFITLFLRIIIDTHVHDQDTEATSASSAKKNGLRVDVINYVRKYLEQLEPLPAGSAQLEKELKVWEEENSEDIRLMFESIVDNFGEESTVLGLDIDHVAIQAYHTVIEDEF